MKSEAAAFVFSTGTMWEHNSFCSSFPIPEMSSACENQEFRLPWLQQSFQPRFFHFFNSVSTAKEFRDLKGLQKNVSSDPVPTESMLQSTFELLPILTNSVVSLLSINYIWIFFSFFCPLVCLVSRMEEISSRALNRALALICNFPQDI